MIQDDAPPHAAGNSQQEQVIDELKGYFDEKFSDLKRNLQTDSQWIAEATVKKVKKDSNVYFKSISNRKQHEFNSSLIDTLDNVEKAVKLREADKAIGFIGEVKASIKHRNKIIRIADTSEVGWATISEYENLDVADNSDDDRKIRRAEERAKKKADLKKSNNMSDNFRRAGSFRGGFNKGGLEGRRFDGRFERGIMLPVRKRGAFRKRM